MKKCFVKRLTQPIKSKSTFEKVDFFWDFFGDFFLLITAVRVFFSGT